MAAIIASMSVLLIVLRSMFIVCRRGGRWSAYLSAIATERHSAPKWSRKHSKVSLLVQFDAAFETCHVLLVVVDWLFCLHVILVFWRFKNLDEKRN